jgi:hypothetical protein
LTVLISLWVLLNFRMTYSPPSRWHKGTFSFNHQRNPNAISRSQKVGGLKYFEVRDV